MAIDGLVSLLELMREQFSKLSFDFHSCFYYDSKDTVKAFVPHRDEYLKETELKDDIIPLKQLARPMILLATIEAEKLFTSCLSHAFILSPLFN